MRILLVEDDEEDYILFQSLVSEINTRPIILTRVETYAEALEKSGRDIFDLFFLDLRLPGHTGIELMHDLREKGHQQPMILLTGRGDHNIDIQAMAEGISDYLEKDRLTPSLLERTIRYAITRATALNALRRSEKMLRILSEKLIQAQEEERKRIARELHDSTSANLAAIKYAIEKKLYETGNDPDSPDTSYYKYLIGLIQETSREIQRICSDLRPSVLDDLGIMAAVDRLCRQFESVYKDIRISKKITIDAADVPEQLNIVIYRVLQEAFNNIARHSRADRVDLVMERTDEAGLRLVISDNGRGFDADTLLKTETENLTGGFGLMNMKERVLFSGGDFTVRSAPRQGTRLEIVWPDRLPAEPAA